MPANKSFSMDFYNVDLSNLIKKVWIKFLEKFKNCRRANVQLFWLGECLFDNINTKVIKLYLFLKEVEEIEILIFRNLLMLLYHLMRKLIIEN